MIFKERIQIEFEYEKGDWLDYEVFAFDGKTSYHFERSLDGKMEKKFVLDTRTDIATLYISSFIARMVETKENYSFEKDTFKNQVKYDIEFFKKDRKEIKGYDCYKVVIDDHRAGIIIKTYVTDELKEYPFRHFLNKRFPKLDGFPLEIDAPRRTGKVFRIINRIDNEELLKEEFKKDYQELSEENLNRITKDFMGKPLNEFKKEVEEEMKRQQKEREEKKKKN